MKRLLFVVVSFAVLVLVAGLASCSVPLTVIATPTPSPIPTEQPCSVQAAEFMKGTDALLTEWDDANAIAGSTGRISLSGPVGKLQEVRRKFMALPSPACADQARTGLQQYMDAVIDGYLLFMADKSDSEVSKKFEEAKGYMDRSLQWYVELKYK